ncbi:pentatricopeptide repeat-containing protein At2g03380, mitochondrial [Argentina anserina]|uniref:pentatricopeptide repeat-containing protein At2g03380, mitochondrial n=1 Tax=Argentina anserina TaxID=57926 RepID=UPI00217661AF|nr:pentatricopeptide repeat-containing protein At2g03380, mitochondrial [Potentilla anserina]
MRLISNLHNQIPRNPLLQSLTLTHFIYKPPPPDPPELSKAKASTHSIFSNPCFNLLLTCRNIDSLRKVHSLLVVHGLSNDRLCRTKLISLYGSFGLLKCARLVFDEMPSPDFYSAKAMLRWYLMHNEYDEVVGLFRRVRMWVRERDNVVYSIVLKACSEVRDVNEGRKVHCEIVKATSPDGFVLNGLMDLYAKCGWIEWARGVFDGIVERCVVCWTTMIVGYVQNECPEDGLVLFNSMREELVEGNQFTLGSVLTACTKLRALHQGKWIHGHLIKNGIGVNNVLGTSLLDMYVKCRVIRDARSIFEEHSMTDIVSWTAMIVGYTQSGCPLEALKLFMDKIWVGLLPNSITITSVISSCAQSVNLNMGRSVHGLGIRLGLEESAVRNALVDMYAKCHMISDAQYIFDTTLDRNVITWSSIICGYSQNGFAYEALQLFHQMTSESFSPDAFTLVSVLSACAYLSFLQVGASLHAYSIKIGILASNLYAGTALLNFYAKCGDAESARAVFDGMRERNTITWTAMIGGYGIQGDSRGSAELFSDLLKNRVEPNEVIFTTLLSACSHTGMVAEGLRYFDSLCQDYNFVPSMKHYACMVDLLARAGKLEETLDFIEKMPFRPDVSLFGAFLHGCGLYSRFDLGELAIKRMLELHPDEASYYVLMRNLYASDGRWSQVNQVLESMKHRGLSKSQAYSQVQMDFRNGSPPDTVACAAC